MGITVNLKVLSEEDSNLLASSPMLVEDLLFPEEEIETDPLYWEVSLGKDWHCIHYLMSHTLDVNSNSTSEAIMGGNELGKNLGYGPARIISKQKVSEIFEFINSYDLSSAYNDLDRELVKTLDIYCNFGFFEGEIEQLNRLFDKLITVYHRANKKGLEVLVYYA